MQLKPRRRDDVNHVIDTLRHSRYAHGVLVLVFLLSTGLAFHMYRLSSPWQTGYVIIDLEISPDGTLVATAETTRDRQFYGPDRDRTTPYTQSIRMRRFVDGRIMQTIGKHSDDVQAVTWRPDARWIASAGGDDIVMVWRPQDGTLVTSLNIGERIRDIAFNPQGSLLATAGNASVRVWNTST